MKKLTLPARIENVERVIEFVNGELEKHDCPPKTVMQIDIAVEEVFVNIAHYAYAPGEGEATITCSVEGDPLRAAIRFEDRGVPYNPLNKEDPDVSLSADERSIGGLGIYMVKKTMDSVEYDFLSGQNILTIQKRL